MFYLALGTEVATITILLLHRMSELTLFRIPHPPLEKCRLLAVMNEGINALPYSTRTIEEVSTVGGYE
jgi:hypothetical protein